MAKYIDAERLKEEIERKKKVNLDDFKKGRITTEALAARGSQLIGLSLFIDSLQQEQDSVAERFARIFRGNLIGIDKEVQQKFEQLYFEVTGNKMYGGYND